MRDSCGCLIRDREDRTDVDLAQDIAVFTRRRAWSIDKVGVPDDRKRRGVDAQHLHHLRCPLGFHLFPEPLKLLRVSAMHDTRTGLRAWGIRAFGRRRYQRLDELVPEANHLVDTHVATDHAFGQARLKRLVHEASVGGEIGPAAYHELRKRHFFGLAPALCMQHAHDTRVTSQLGNQFYPPNSLPAIAPVLLEDTRAGRSEP